MNEDQSINLNLFNLFNRAGTDCKQTFIIITKFKVNILVDTSFVKSRYSAIGCQTFIE